MVLSSTGRGGASRSTRPNSWPFRRPSIIGRLSSPLHNPGTAETFAAFVFLLPTVLVLGTFSLYPAVYSLSLSFFRWDGFSPQREFVGLAHYISLARSPEFWNALRVTLLYSAGVIIGVLAFGTLGEFQELVKEMHARGMRIILDGVFNHCGDRHPAFMSAVRYGPQSPTWDWFLFYGYPVRKRPKPNYAHGGIYYLPKWNLRNPEVRRHLQDAIRYWTEQGIDGWRLDVPWYIEEHEFWREMRALVRSINPEAYMVGEHWDDASPWLNAEEFDGATDYRLRNAILRYLAGEDGEGSSSELAATMKSLLADYPWSNRLAMWNLLGSHDTPRVATILRGDVARVMLGFVITFTFPGVPQLYYGDEVGMRGQNDPDCRRCFPWDESTWAHELRRFVQHLTRIRRRYPALQHGQMRILYSHGGVLVYQRGTGSESILVVIGNGQDEGELQLPPLDNVRTNTPYAWHELLRWDDYEVSPRPGRATWEAGTRLRNENRPRAWVFAAARPEDVGESSAPGTPQPVQVRVFRSSPDL